MHRPPKVNWYEPRQLLDTAIRTVVSGMLGKMIDTRRLAALDGGTDDECVIHRDEGFESFDFMADTGDGWDATFTMAFLLTAPELEVDGRRLPRSDALILGGDEVYPVASDQAYRERLIGPFEAARKAVSERFERRRLPRKPVFLIPGNHDWYDSLSSFNHRFIERKTKDFGSFKPQQKRSYFVIKLSHGWEIWGIDVQLGRNIDDRQFKFFSAHAKTLTPSSKVILCSAEPDRVYGNLSGRPLRFTMIRICRLVFLRQARLVAIFAGDVHNYQRYEELQVHGDIRYTRQHVVSGGGGAFLHPTHAFPKESPHNRVQVGEPKALYPSPDVSRRLTRQLPLFAFRNTGMALLCCTLYTLMFWTGDLPSSWTELLLYPISHLASTVLIVASILGGWVFARSGVRATVHEPAESPAAGHASTADTSGPSNEDDEDDENARDAKDEPESLRQEMRHDRSRFIPWIAQVLGFGHGVAHVALAYLCWRAALAWTPSTPPAGLDAGLWSVAREYLIRLEVFGAGLLLAGTLFGCYLWLALNVFRFHHNEAFSAIGSTRYKNFLRCRVRSENQVEVTVIGVDKTYGPEVGPHPVPLRIIETFTLEA